MRVYSDYSKLKEVHHSFDLVSSNMTCLSSSFTASSDDITFAAVSLDVSLMNFTLDQPVIAPPFLIVFLAFDFEMNRAYGR